MVHAPIPPMKDIEPGRLMIPEYGQGGIIQLQIDTRSWEHVCSARFGDGRLCGWNHNTKWTGDSFRYDIFKRTTRWGKVEYALRWWNGSGEGWLVCPDKSKRGEVCLLAEIANNPVEERRWDFCHFLFNTAHKSAHLATAEENARMSKAFLEKRLKRRKRNKKVTVEVLDKSPSVVYLVG